MIRKEIWKDVENYEGLYQVSSFGRVYSFKRSGNKGGIMKVVKVNGYGRVTLSKNNEHKFHLIHRLVANAFIENQFNKKYVNHKDGNKLNNNVENLEWVTGSENMIHAYKNGLQIPTEKQKNATRQYAIKNYSKAVLQFDFEGNLIRKYYSASEAARQLGVKFNSNISKCCRGGLPSAYKFKWKYEQDIDY